MEALFTNMTWAHMAIYIGIVVVGVVVALTSFAFLMPLDSVPAVTGVFIIIGIAYAICICLWAITMTFYSSNKDNLIWLNTHLMFLVVLPATIGATAMNVTSIQNTRNLLAGKICT